MIGLFKRTSAPVQTAMLVEMIRMLMECQQVVTLPNTPAVPSKPDRLRQLEALGFTGTSLGEEFRRQVDEWKAKTDAVDEVRRHRERLTRTVQVLLDARQRFGNDTLLIRYDDFERLMHRYNLVCGPFDAYTGDVPVEKMADIADLKKKMLSTPWYVAPLMPVTGYEVISSYHFDGIPSYIKRFPFIKSQEEPYFKSSDNRVDLQGNKIGDWDLGYRLSIGKETDLFICAPAKDMKKLERIVSLRRYSDPFICAYTDFGILVFTRWGEEADDKVIRKYEHASQWLDRAREFIGKAAPQRHGGFID